MTQEATQQLDEDFRSNVNRSFELDDDSKADVFCILHPTSMIAHKALALVAADNDLEKGTALVAEDNNLDIATARASVSKNSGSLTADNAADDDPKTSERDQYVSSFKDARSRDVFLRLSALDSTKDPLLGFCFGRNKNSSDFPLYDPEARISGNHFRIYVNEYGAIMLEDASRNGTCLDNILLRAKEKENDHVFRHTLEHGQVIKLAMVPGQHDDDAIKFIVRIPQREGEVENMYDRNLNDYFIRLNAIKLDRARQANPSPPVLFPHAASDTAQSISISSSTISKRSRNWKGGDKYNVVRKIGQGAFATVYKITQKSDGKAFAAKELEKRRFVKDGILDNRIGNELKIMGRIQHENIVRFEEFVEWEEYLYIVMEMIPGGDLGQMIHAAGLLNEDQGRDMTTQLLSALEYLHNLGITHRDIKPDNIMLSNHNPIRVTLTDFGLSKMVQNEDTFLRTFCGTLLYCAPEVYHEFYQYDRNGQYHPERENRHIVRDPYTSSCDIWSLAGVLFFSLCGEAPFPVHGNQVRYQDLLRLIMTSALDIRPLQKQNLSEKCIKFLKHMLQKWPEQRPSIEKLKAHAWITGLPSTQTTNGDDDEEVDDEVDLISDHDATEPINTELARSTSNLILDSRMEMEEATNSESLEQIDRDNLRLSLQRSWEIPSSVNSGGSSTSESYAFMKNGPERSRLFGELGSSALGSSGVVPNGRLNLPLSSYGNSQPRVDSDSDISKHGMNESNIDPRFRNANSESPIQRVEFSEGSAHQNSPSLLGAESVFGQLQVGSPEAAPSPQNDTAGSPEAQSPDGNAHNLPTHPTQSFVTAPQTSMRRQREENEVLGADEPTPKRHKILTADQFPIDKTYWWDPRQMTTWHDDYPILTHGELKALEAEAKAQGKEYKPSRTNTAPKYSGTGRSTDCISPTPSVSSSSRKASSSANNGQFQVPHRILAKLVGRQGTALPSIKINVTEQFTSWGRGPNNTHVYHDATDTRIGKYTLKLIQWSPGMDPNDPLKATDSSFYIASKSLNGLKVNGFHVPSYERSNYRGESRYWVQLRHGDVITVWDSTIDSNPELHVILKFEFLGSSAKSRSPDEPVAFVPEEDRGELEALVIRRETEFHNKPKPKSPEIANNSRSVARARSGGPVERVRQESGVSAKLPQQSLSMANTADQSDRTNVINTADRINTSTNGDARDTPSSVAVGNATSSNEKGTVTGRATPLNQVQSSTVNSRSVQSKGKDHAGSLKPLSVKKSSGGGANTADKARISRHAVRSVMCNNSPSQLAQQSFPASEAPTEHE